MLEKGTISVRQFAILVFLFVVGSNVFFAPPYLAAEAKQDAWLAGIVGTGLGLLLVLFYHHLGDRFPRMTLVQYTERIMGVWLGKAFSVFFLLYPFLIAAMVVRELGDFMKEQMLPNTPIEGVLVLQCAVIALGCLLGLEALSRAGEVFFPIVLLFFLILLLLIFPLLDFQQLFPMMEDGVKPVIGGAVSLVSFSFLETVTFLMILPFVKPKEKTKRGFLTGAFWGGMFLSILTGISILVLGSELTSYLDYPTFVVSQKINVGDFVERIEMMISVIWFLTIYIESTICFYVSVLGFSQVLRLQSTRPLVFPLALLLFVFSLRIVPNDAYIEAFDEVAWIPFTVFFGFLLPLFLLAGAVLRRLGKKERQATTK